MTIHPLKPAETLPHPVLPSKISDGDVVHFESEPLPVIITGGNVVALHHVFTWISVARWSSGAPVTEGIGVHDLDEEIELLARGETVRADEVHDGDVLLLTGCASDYGIVVGEPRLIRPDVVDIAWKAGCLPKGGPQVIGFLQKDPSYGLRRAPRRWTR